MTANLVLDPVDQLVTVSGDDTPTPSVLWDRAIQQAVINNERPPGPTIASRLYGLTHTAMYDAWAAYDSVAVATQLWDNLQRPASENTDANKAAAMSYAAYRVATEILPTQQPIFDALMSGLGLDPNNTSTDITTPAGIGNVSAEALMTIRRVDGSNQLNGFADNTGYRPTNASSEAVTDPFFWTPERVPINDPNGRLQNFLTPHWGNVLPFGINSGSQVRPVPPEPFLLPGVEGAVNAQTRTITLADGSQLPITPNLVGTIINPGFISQAQEVLDFSANLTDEQKLIAEFWEDGVGTSFPPGTWMTFGQFVSARDDNSIDQDALLFFALGNAVFDAGVATWEAKRFYDYARPVRAIRDLGALGLIGTPGVDEVTGETGNVVRAWTPESNRTQTILAENFLTYQTPGGDPSPPFSEYTSGHSAFSASGATVLELFTGSDEFGGSVTFAPGQSRFEPGVTPQQTTTLAWETFSEAGDEGGISRLYGGIHFEDGDINGRTIGRNVGTAAWARASGYAGLGQSGFTLLRGSAAGEVLTSPDGALFAAGFEGDDVLVGGNADDVLAGGVGDDVLLGNDGADLYAIAPGEGADVVVDFADGSDRILLNGGLTFEGLSFADATLTVPGVGAVPVAEIRSGSEVLARLANVSASALGAADFLTA
ncbi:MAG: DUF6851 domain-containing protein [Cyanobacteria bacterium P01_C01_bin.89]